MSIPRQWQCWQRKDLSSLHHCIGGVTTTGCTVPSAGDPRREEKPGGGRDGGEVCYLNLIVGCILQVLFITFVRCFGNSVLVWKAGIEL